MNKVYLCDSDSVFDVFAWNPQFTENNIAVITKSDVPSLRDMVKDELQKATKIDKPQKATGQTWSQLLLQKYAPARWITYRRNRLLLKILKQGTKAEHAVVVFSANPAFQHLKIIPKSHDEYQKIEREILKRKKQRAEAMRSDVTPEDLEKIKESKKEKQRIAQELKEEQVAELKDIAGIDKKEQIITNADAQLLQKLIDKKIDREREKERRRKMLEEMGETEKDKKKTKTVSLKDKKVDPTDLIGEDELSLLEMAKKQGVIKENELPTEDGSKESMETLQELGLVEKTEEGYKLTDDGDKIADESELEKLAKDLTESAMTEMEKEKVVKTLAEGAENLIADQAIIEAVGEEEAKEIIGDRKLTSTGNDTLDKRLKKAVNQLSYDQAMELAQTREKYKRKKRTLDKKYRKRIHKPKGNMEITSLQGVGVGDIDVAPETKDQAIERILQKEINRMNAERNLDFYTNYYEDRAGKSTTNKALDLGAIETINALSSMYNRGAGLSKNLIAMIGVENSAKIVAGAIAKRHGKEKAIKEMEEFAIGKYDEVVDKAMKRAKESIDRTENYQQMADEGIIHGASAWSAKGREMAKMGREIGMTVGSLQTTASVIDNMRETGTAGDIVMDMGSNLERAKRDIKRAGLRDGEYALKKYTEKGKSRWKLVITSDQFSNLIDPPSMEAQRDKAVADIKAGRRYDENWLPEGKMKADGGTHYDFLTTKELEEHKGKKPEDADGWERFKNKEGEKGFTSEHPEGKTLYRKQRKSGIFKSPQKMVQMAMEKKRAVMNLGAGTGKTMGFLATIQGVIDKGDMNTFAFHTMPSRLRDEFYKDAQKFFPHLKVLNLDSVKGMDAKDKALAEASEGKYDIVISGMDSMKLGGQDAKSKKLLKKVYDGLYKSEKERLKREKRDVVTEIKNGKEYNVSYWSTAKGEAHKKRLMDKAKAQLPNKHKWLPDVIASHNPSIVTVDEAHEGFKNIKHKGSSVRANAIKTIAKKPEYFIPATGTVLRNDIGELAGMLHVTNPEEFPNPTKWTNKYESTNQGNTVFQEQAVEGFRQSLDDLMLTEHLQVMKKDKKTPVKMTETVHKPKLGDKQKKKLREVENIYHAEKKINGHAIMNKDTYELHKDDGGQIKASNDFAGKKMTSVDDDGKVRNTKEAREYIKSQGLDPDKHQVVEMGQRGASARRDSKYNKVLNAGDWKENAKAKQVGQVADKAIKRGEKTIIFYERKESLPMLQKMFADKYGYKDGEEMHYIDGSVKFGKHKGSRNDKVTQFNSNPDSRIMFASSAGMTGLNMQKANNVIWLSRTTANYLQKQGNARAMRTGQEKDVNVHYVDTATIFDDRRVDLNRKKEKTAEAVGEAPEKRLTMARALAERRKNVKKAISLIIKL